MKRKRPTGAQEQARSRRYYDIAGLALSFTGAACFLWLAWRRTAPVPGLLTTTLRWCAGSGAYAAPLVLMFIGIVLLVGWRRFSVSHATFGLVLAFLTFVTWRHIHGDPQGIPTPLRTDGPFGSYVADPQWAARYVEGAGGYLGAALGWALSGLMGIEASYLFLVMFALMSLVLIVDKPFLDMVRSLKRPAASGISVARKGVDALRGRSRRDGDEETPRRPSLPAGAAEGVIPAERGPGLLERLRSRQAVTLTEAPAEPDHVVSERPGRRKRTEASQPPAETEPTIPMTVEPERATPYVPFTLPPTSLLRDAPPVVNKKAQQELAEKIRILEKTLDEFGIGANVVEIAHGPTVTRYEIQLAPGINVARIQSLAGNLAMALAAINVRIEAPIPGKAAIGVEVPNSYKATVSLKECVESQAFREARSRLAFALGKDVAGDIRIADLTEMPHLLVGGATNSGKSVCLNALIASIVYRSRPDEVKFIMVDPKRVELSLWEGIPHLAHPVVRDPRQAAGILRAAIHEMDRRYDLLSGLGARNITSYNERVPEGERLPHLVIIVDELAELMVQAAAEIETSVERLAHLARATGIHLVIATQRPSVDVITGKIKANIPSRIAFACIQANDGRTILDRNGAERLIGRGDMLFLPIDAQSPTRIQGCYLSEGETEAIVNYLKQQDTPEYTMKPVEEAAAGEAGGGEAEFDDELFEKALRLVVSTGHASASLLQRRMRIGYARSSRLVDVMEQRGFVGPQDGAKLREVLITRDDVDHMFGRSA